MSNCPNFPRFEKNNHQQQSISQLTVSLILLLLLFLLFPTKTIPDKTQPSTIINLQSTQLYDDHAWFTDIWHGGSVHDRCTRYTQEGRGRVHRGCVLLHVHTTIYIYSWALTCTRHVDQKGAVYRTSHDSTGFSVSLVTPRERRACHVSSPISVILPHRRQLRRLFNGNRMDNGRRGWASIRLMRATRNEFLLLKIWNYVYDRLRPRNYIVFFGGGGGRIWKATCNNLIEKFCISMWYRDPKNWQKRSKDLERLA